MVAVACTSANSSTVTFIDGTTADAVEGMTLSTFSVLEERRCSACTEISFDNVSGVVALLQDSGNISLVNIETGSVVSSIIPDGSGASHLKFSNSGKLYTLGRSPRGQLQVWDNRGLQNRNGGAYCMIHSSHLPPAEFVFAAPHATREQYVYCGDSSGHIYEVDLRASGVSRLMTKHEGSGKYNRASISSSVKFN